MYSVRVNSELGDRIDAEFYNPEALAAIAKIRKVSDVSTLGAEISEGYRVVYHGTDSVANLGASQKLGFLSPTQISKDGEIEFESVDQLPLYYKDEYPKGIGKSGELLIEVKGNVSKVAVLPQIFPKNLMVSGSLYKAQFSSKLDSHYVLAFLKSKHGQLLKNRLTSNTIISYIGKDDLYSIPLLLLDSLAQKYIGDKVRQAEQLRDFARKLISNVDIEINSLALPIKEMPKMINKVTSELLVDRLDPRPYRTHCLELHHAISSLKNTSLSSCVSMASGCPVSSKEFLENFDIPLVRIRNIGYKELNGLDTGVSKSFYQLNKKYHAKLADVVLGMDGDFRAQFFLEDELPMLINQRVAIFSTETIRPELLTHWLNRPEGQIQLYQWTVKTTVDHTSLSDLKKVLIPRFETDYEESLADNLKLARLARFYARKLLIAANFIVEGVIEMGISEQQLICNQQQLSNDESSLDHELLSRLKESGFDTEGRPLFPDLDQLFDLLAQSQQFTEDNQ